MKPLESRLDELRKKREEVSEENGETHYAENAIESSYRKADTNHYRLRESRHKLYGDFRSVRTELMELEQKLGL